MLANILQSFGNNSLRIFKEAVLKKGGFFLFLGLNYKSVLEP
jgi:hypothetical protein